MKNVEVNRNCVDMEIDKVKIGGFEDVDKVDGIESIQKIGENNAFKENGIGEQIRQTDGIGTIGEFRAFANIHGIDEAENAKKEEKIEKSGYARDIVEVDKAKNVQQIDQIAENTKLRKLEDFQGEPAASPKPNVAPKPIAKPLENDRIFDEAQRIVIETLKFDEIRDANAQQSDDTSQLNQAQRAEEMRRLEAIERSKNYEKLQIAIRRFESDSGGQYSGLVIIETQVEEIDIVGNKMVTIDEDTASMEDEVVIVDDEPYEQKADERKEMERAPDQMDVVLEETGQFGSHQLFHLILVLVPIILAGTYDVNYIVTSATDEYR